MNKKKIYQVAAADTCQRNVLKPGSAGPIKTLRMKEVRSNGIRLQDIDRTKKVIVFGHSQTSRRKLYEKRKKTITQGNVR